MIDLDAVEMMYMARSKDSELGFCCIARQAPLIEAAEYSVNVGLKKYGGYCPVLHIEIVGSVAVCRIGIGRINKNRIN